MKNGTQRDQRQMNLTLANKDILSKTAFIILITTFLCGLILSLTGCSDKLEIQQMYDFSLSTMLVQKRIIKGETAEIRSAPVVA